MKKALVLLGVAIALAFSGCSAFYGDDGTATLAVQVSDTTYEGAYVVADSSLNWSNWSLGTAYSVTDGTYTFKYNVVKCTKYDSSSSVYYYYYYYANGYSTSKSYPYYIGYYYTLPYSFWTIGKAAYTDGYYLSTSVTIAVNKGKLFQDGADRSYVLTLPFSGSVSISGNSVALDSKTILDTSDKTVKVFTSAADTITVTTTKVKAAELPGGSELKLNSTDIPVPNEVSANGQKSTPTP
jgi:hypothetical protein